MGGCTPLPAPGRTGAGPHRGAGGSFATGSGCGSAPSRLHPWQGGTEAPAFPSLASLVVLIREAGAGRAALPTSRGNERCCRSRLMGNRFPGAGGPRGWWCCARLCPRSSPPCGGGWHAPYAPSFPSSKSPFELGAVPRCPQGPGPHPLEGGSSAGLCAEHDVLLRVCDIHAYRCTLVMAASKKNANKTAPGASAGLPKSAAQPCQVMLCPQGADLLRWLYWALAGARPDLFFF